jgi:hypothetical protein
MDTHDTGHLIGQIFLVLATLGFILMICFKMYNKK